MMAAEEKQAEAGETEVKGGSKLKLVLIVVGALILVGGSIGGTLLIVGGGDQSAEAEVEEVEVSRGDPSYIDLKPAFTVNLAPEDPVGFLQISMQVLTFNDDVANDLEKHKPLIRNNLLVLFGQQKSADLRVPEGKEQLQKTALETVQTVINEHGSGGEVENVFFTSFVMQ